MRTPISDSRRRSRFVRGKKQKRKLEYSETYLVMGHRRLSVPVICTAMMTGGNIRHVREDGVDTFRGCDGQPYYSVRNPTNITFCGLASMDDIDVEVDRRETNIGKWCDDCRQAALLWMTRQELNP